MICKPGEGNWYKFEELFLSDYGKGVVAFMGERYNHDDLKAAYLAMPGDFNIRFGDSSNLTFECSVVHGVVLRYVDRIWQW